MYQQEMKYHLENREITVEHAYRSLKTTLRIRDVIQLHMAFTVIRPRVSSLFQSLEMNHETFSLFTFVSTFRTEFQKVAKYTNDQNWKRVR